jgi:hypothetical protein
MPEKLHSIWGGHLHDYRYEFSYEACRRENMASYYSRRTSAQTNTVASELHDQVFEMYTMGV